MKNKLWRRLPCDIFHLGAVEHWLGDLAAEGWRLEKINGWRAVFRRAQPRRVRYRFSPYRKGQSCPDDTEQALFEEMGWEYVTSLFSQFAIYASERPDAPELSTDPLVEYTAYEALYRRLRSELAWSLLRLPLTALIWSFFYHSVPLWSIETLFSGALELYALLLLVYLSGLPRMIGQFRKIHGLRRSLRLGEPRGHDDPYPQKPHYLPFCWEIITWAALAVGLVLAVGRFGGVPVEHLDDLPPSLSLAALEGREIYQPSVLHSDYSCYSNLLSAEFCERRQSDELASGLLWLDSVYYRARFPSTAPALYRSIARHEPEDKTDTLIFGEAVPMPCEDSRFDGIACFSRQKTFENGEKGYRALGVVVRRGGQVLSAQYTGEQPLPRLLDEIDALFTRCEGGN